MLFPFLIPLNSLVAQIDGRGTLDTLALASAFKAEVAQTRSPGAALAVVLGGRIAFVRALGVANAETREPMTPETLVRIGSITKTFTGLTALLLQDAGRLRLEAPIGRMTPGLNRDLGRLTMAQLLSHTAGLWNEGAGDGAHDEDALARRVLGWTGTRRFAPAGDVWSYSSPGYWLAGHVLAAVERKPYADVVTERLLRRLGMTRSTFRPLMAFTFPFAQDHAVGDSGARILRPYKDDATTWPSGSLFSSAVELARLGGALSNGGIVDGKQVIPAHVVAKMLEVHGSQAGDTCGYSYGLSVCAERGEVAAGHYGFRGGSGAVLKVVPSRKFAIVILSNRNGGIFSATEAKAMELLLGPAPADSAPAVTAIDAARRREIAGRYIAGGDTLTIAVRGDSAVYRYNSEAAAPLRARGAELVVVDGAGEVQQVFQIVRGKRTGERYLFDGLNAYRKAPASR